MLWLRVTNFPMNGLRRPQCVFTRHRQTAPQRATNGNYPPQYQNAPSPQVHIQPTGGGGGGGGNPFVAAGGNPTTIFVGGNPFSPFMTAQGGYQW